MLKQVFYKIKNPLKSGGMILIAFMLFMFVEKLSWSFLCELGIVVIPPMRLF